MRARALALIASLPLIAATVHAQPAPTAAPSAPAAPTAAAAAQPAPTAAPAPSQEDRDRANALMDEGDAKVESGDLPAALTAYESAHAIMRVPTTGIEVARTLDRLGHLLRALAAAREIAAMPATPGEPKPFTDAREQARALVTTLEARLPTLSITVKIATPGAAADVTLDGKTLGKEDLAAPLPLAPGRYRIAAAAPGHTPASVDVVLKERDRGQVALVLARVSEAAPPPTAPPPPPRPRLSPFIPAGVAIAGAGLVAGAITGGLALSAAHQAAEECPDAVCSSVAKRNTAESHYRRADAFAIASDISFVAAIAGAAMGIYGVSVSLSPPKPDPSQPQGPTAKVLFGPGSAALQMKF